MLASYQLDEPGTGDFPSPCVRLLDTGVVPARKDLPLFAVALMGVADPLAAFLVAVVVTVSGEPGYE